MLDHPPYPRPVPHIDCDEDILLPGATVIFENDDDENSDIDQIAAKRAAKRRRIQHHARAYLRGQGIFILSAGLRGPFDSNWGNPWVKADQGTRLPSGVRQAELDVPVQNVRLYSSASSSISALGKGASVQTPAPITTPLENPFRRATNLSEPSHSNEKVEGWLRRNSALFQQDNFPAPLSPTPKAKSSPIQRRQDPKYRWTPTKQLITVNSQDLRAPIHEPVSCTDEYSQTTLPGKKSNVAPKNAHSRLQKALESQTDYRAVFHDLQARSPVLVKPVTHPDRAEAEILRIKHNPNEDETSMSSDKLSYQSVLYREIRKNENANVIRPEKNSLVTPPVSDQEQPDKAPRHSQSTQEKGKHILVAPEISSQLTHTPWKSKLNNVPYSFSQPVSSKAPASNMQLGDPNGARKKSLSLTQKTVGMSQANTSEHHIPTLSTNASDAQLKHLPPSAQHKPDLQAMPSNASSSIRLLEALSTAASLPHGEEEDSNGGKEQELQKSNEPLSNGVDDELDNNITNPEFSQVERQSKDLKLVDSPVKEATRTVAVHDPSPQESNILRFKVAEARSSLDSAPKLPLTNPAVQENSSLKKRNERSSKRERKAAFVAEASSMSSNESIRSVLKVRKNDNGSGRVLKSPPLSSNGHEDDFSEPKHENSLQSSLANSLRAERKLSISCNTSSGRKGILKNANAPPLASRQQAPDAGIEEDDFDLNGAIDELGSFLSTWDAEKDGLKVV